MQKLIFAIIALSFICCKEKSLSYDLNNIEVFAVPFGINFPINIRESAVEETESYLIEDEIKLHKIETYISELKKTQSAYISEEIYLRCKLHCKDNKTYVMDYNKNQIRLNGVWYSDHSEMIELILKSKKE